MAQLIRCLLLGLFWTGTCIAVCWMIGTFISLRVNIFEWHGGARFAIVVISLFGGGILTAISFDIEDDIKRRADAKRAAESDE